MALVANQDGVLQGKFRIPEDIPAGTKRVAITGSAGSHATAAFTGDGTLITSTRRRITTVTTLEERRSAIPVDPLAQTFMLSRQCQLGGAEVYVMSVGSSDITLQIRNTEVGFPNQEILAEGRIKPSSVKVGQWNRVEFDEPTYLQAGVEYALVAMCNDPDASLAVAELGKWDVANNSWVTQQPYNVGVLLSSSNASTWTAHQDRDLAFRLLARRYTSPEKNVDLGTVVINNATDLLVLGMTDNPENGADSKLQLTLPDGRTVNTGADQVVQLGSPQSGNVSVQAVLRSNGSASAVLVPGSQIVAGSTAVSADYVTRAMDADATGCNVRVIFDAIIPSGAEVNAYIQGSNSDEWLLVSRSGDAQPIGGNVFEYQHFYENFMDARVRVKLELSGTAASRPLVANLRVSIT